MRYIHLSAVVCLARMDIMVFLPSYFRRIKEWLVKVLAVLGYICSMKVVGGVLWFCAWLRSL
jgi:hypothetical protein